MVKTAENRNLHDGCADGRWFRRSARDPLTDTLVRARVVEVGAVLAEQRSEVVFAENHHVIEALGAHAA